MGAGYLFHSGPLVLKDYGRRHLQKSPLHNRPCVTEQLLAGTTTLLRGTQRWARSRAADTRGGLGLLRLVQLEAHEQVCRHTRRCHLGHPRRRLNPRHPVL